MKFLPYCSTFEEYYAEAQKMFDEKMEAWEIFHDLNHHRELSILPEFFSPSLDTCNFLEESVDTLRYKAFSLALDGQIINAAKFWKLAENISFNVECYRWVLGSYSRERIEKLNYSRLEEAIQKEAAL